MKRDYLCLSKRIIYYAVGLVLLSLGITLTLICELGAGGWDALVENLSKSTSISMGIWICIVASVLILLAGVMKKSLPDFNALIVAFFLGRLVDFWYYAVFDFLEMNGYIEGLLILILGLLMIAFGSAMIFATNLPRNHTETFVFSIVETFHFQYKTVKTLVDILALSMALLVGFMIEDFSNLGIGTICSTFFMGVLTQCFMPFAEKGLHFIVKGKRFLNSDRKII